MSLTVDVHRSLDPYLRRQLGVVTRQHALEAGMSPSAVVRLSRRSDGAHRGVYLDPAAAPTREQRILAGVFAAGSTALASHRTAAAMWGVANMRCDLIEVTKFSSAACLAPGIVAHRTRRLDEADRSLLRGVPLTAPARTAIDLATVVGEGLVARALEQWLSSGVLRMDALEAAVRRNRYRPGCRTVAGIVRTRLLGRAEPDSPAERELGRVLSRAGIVGLVHHFVVTLASGRTYELDWSIPALALGFEMDGYGVHLRSLEQFEHDRVRRNELEIEGWQILNFTRRQVHRAPERVVEQVQRAIDARHTSDPSRFPVRIRRKARSRSEFDTR